MTSEEMLALDAEAWKAAQDEYEAALAARRRRIRRAVQEDKLTLQTVADAYGVSRQYIGKVLSG